MERPEVQQFEDRKRDHLRHSLDPRHQAAGQTGLASVRLIHDALPDFDLDQVSLAAECLGQPSATPFYVAGMTAGHPEAAQWNRQLAIACAERGWAMGVGSQRREFEGWDRGKSIQPDAWAEIREAAPTLKLFANLGITQLVRADIQQVRELRDLIGALGAQALCIHLNSLQEALQPEGTPHFKGAFETIARVRDSINVPVVIKETGCGLSAATLARLAPLGLAAIDVSGLGGTHWGRIEGARAAQLATPSSRLRALAAETFAEWGISTRDSVLAAAQKLRLPTEIWASGGVRTGLDAAKLIALGAHCVGYAQPALVAVQAGEGPLREWMERQEFELRVALFCTGSRTPAELRAKQTEGWQWA